MAWFYYDPPGPVPAPKQDPAPSPVPTPEQGPNPGQALAFKLPPLALPSIELPPWPKFSDFRGASNPNPNPQTPGSGQTSG
jgi:hypothetical protein